jgi:hypothetical protein
VWKLGWKWQKLQSHFNFVAASDGSITTGLDWTKLEVEQIEFIFSDEEVEGMIWEG